jgi:hypothetical protein
VKRRCYRLTWFGADGNASVVLNRHGNDLHLYRILLTDNTGYQLTNAE